MKKVILSIILVLAVAFAVISCGEKNTPPEVDAQTDDTASVSDTADESAPDTDAPETDGKTDDVAETEKVKETEKLPYENVTIGGIPLANFKLEGDGATDFQVKLRALAGAPKSDGGNGRIVIKRTENSSYRGIKAKLDGDTVTLTVHSYGPTEAEAADFLMSLVEDRKSDDMGKLDASGVCMSGEGKLTNTYYRLTKDKALNIAYLGGSITYGQGDGAKEETCWAGLTTEWFKKKFPDAAVSGLNAGICDSTSDYGLFRLERDVFKDRKGNEFIPDLFFIEYTSNDAMPEDAISAYTEAIIQNVYAKNPYCDIIFLYTKQNCDDKAFESMNVYKADHALAKKYGLVEMAPGRALYHMMMDQFGTVKDTDLADASNAVHPSAKGYAVYMEVISEYFDYYLLSNVPEKAEYKKADLIDGAGLMMTPHVYPIEAVTLALDGGWDYTEDHQISLGRAGKTDVKWLTAEKDGASFTFEFDGTGFGFMLGRLDAGQNADFSYSVDGGAFKDFSVASNYKHMRTKMPEYRLDDGHHTVTVKVKACENGSTLNVIALMINGTMK